MKSGMPIPDEIQQKVTNYPLKGLGLLFVAETCGKNAYKLIGLKVKFHSDQLVQVKRAIAVDVVPSAKTEVGMCDGAQHSADENGSIRKPG